MKFDDKITRLSIFIDHNLSLKCNTGSRAKRVNYNFHYFQFYVVVLFTLTETNIGMRCLVCSGSFQEGIISKFLRSFNSSITFELMPNTIYQYTT